MVLRVLLLQEHELLDGTTERLLVLVEVVDEDVGEVLPARGFVDMVVLEDKCGAVIILHMLDLGDEGILAALGEFLEELEEASLNVSFSRVLHRGAVAWREI